MNIGQNERAPYEEDVHKALRRATVAVLSYSKNCPQDDVHDFEVNVRPPYVCVKISGARESDIAYGFSKCHPNDPFDIDKGVHIATQRAILDFHTRHKNYQERARYGIEEALEYLVTQ